MKFHDEREAYEWATGIMAFFGSPRAAVFNPCIAGNMHREYMVLDAITVMSAARKHDIVDWRGSWFREYFMPCPLTVRDWHWSEAEKARLHGAVRDFENELTRLGYLWK